MQKLGVLLCLARYHPHHFDIFVYGLTALGFCGLYHYRLVEKQGGKSGDFHFEEPSHD